VLTTITKAHGELQLRGDGIFYVHVYSVTKIRKAHTTERVGLEGETSNYTHRTRTSSRKHVACAIARKTTKLIPRKIAERMRNERAGDAGVYRDI
jgi:hypothetical protein